MYEYTKQNILNSDRQNEINNREKAICPFSPVDQPKMFSIIEKQNACTKKYYKSKRCKIEVNTCKHMKLQNYKKRKTLTTYWMLHSSHCMKMEYQN